MHEMSYLKIFTHRVGFKWELPDQPQHIKLQWYMEDSNKQQFQWHMPVQRRKQQRTHQNPEKLYITCIPRDIAKLIFSHKKYVRSKPQ